MCGIFGVIGERGTDAQARAVLAVLRHRGPDDRGVHRFDEGWLAHTRLAIIDLSASGRQPMANARGTAWITYNGEIYNYVELREQLEGYPFRTRTDTEVILAAYERWGEECLGRLRGMFAFGLWDARRRRLFCATDRFSIKPLYYAVDGTRFLFSSEAKALARCGIRLQPNGRMVYDYLALGLLDHSEQTLFDGILQLRPGTCLTYEGGRLSVRRYWDLDGSAETGDGPPVEAVEERLTEAVRLHLRGDVEVGLSLSSGVDSQLLRALVLRTERRAGPLECFTYAFPGTPYDEWERSLPARPPGDGCRYHAVALTPRAMLEELGALIEVMEGPVGGVGIYGYWRNAKLAADRGIKVLLDGQGADELFAGYRYYYETHIRQLSEQGRRGRAAEELLQLQQAHGEPAQPLEAWLAAHPASAGVMAPDGTPLTSGYLDPAFAAQAGGPPPEFPAPCACAVKNAMYHDLFFLKIPKLLRFQDRCAMAWGVEVRVPYLDHVLAERLFSVPAERLLAGGLTKALLRAIGSRHVPAAALQAPKLYVATPQREWLKTALREPVEAIIRDSRLARDGYLVRETLLSQFQAYAQDRELGNSFFVWKFINLELWYRTFIASPVLEGAAPA